MLPEQLPTQLPSIVAPLFATITAIIGAYFGTRSKKGQRAAIEFETRVRRILRRQLNIPSPRTREISEDELDQALAAAIPAYEGNEYPIDVVTSDGTLLAPLAADVSIVRMLAGATEWLPYRPERFDCENFAGAFRVLAAFIAGTNTIGIVYDWSGDHAYNVIINADGEAVFYEPQDDEIVDIGQGNYELENGLIVF